MTDDDVHRSDLCPECVWPTKTNLPKLYPWKMEVPSQSVSGKTWTVRQELTCGCPGYFARRTCAHVKAVRQLIEEEESDGNNR